MWPYLVLVDQLLVEGQVLGLGQNGTVQLQVVPATQAGHTTAQPMLSTKREQENSRAAT